MLRMCRSRRRCAIAAVAIALCAWASTAGAQRAGSSGDAAPSLHASDQIKVTGCVVKDDEGRITLTNAAVEVQPYYGPGASTVRASARPQASRTTFILQGQADVSARIGQRVAVVGRIAPGSATSGGTPIGGSQVVYVPRLEAQSVKTIAAKCR